MKVGAENKKQLKIMVVLMVVLLAVALYNFRDQLFGSASAANVPIAPISPPSGKSAAKGTSNVNDDPRLRLDVLEWSQKQKYEAGGRNIFRMEAPPVPKSIAEVRPREPIGPPAPPTPTPTPPPPPIPIIYYGYASPPGETRKIFLQKKDEEPIFVARKGDIVARRYRVLEIQPTSVTMEDMFTKHSESIKLTPRDTQQR